MTDYLDSNANYDARNAAWMIEMFAGILGSDNSEIQFVYNTLGADGLPIILEHPGDGLYLPEKSKRTEKSYEQKRYESFAKQSHRLKVYEENSPAKITYFQSSIQPQP